MQDQLDKRIENKSISDFDKDIMRGLIASKALLEELEKKRWKVGNNWRNILTNMKRKMIPPKKSKGGNVATSEPVYEMAEVEFKTAQEIRSSTKPKKALIESDSHWDTATTPKQMSSTKHKKAVVESDSDKDTAVETSTLMANPSSIGSDVLTDICKDESIEVRGVVVDDVEPVFCSVRLDSLSRVVDFFDPLPSALKTYGHMVKDLWAYGIHNTKEMPQILQ